MEPVYFLIIISLILGWAIISSRPEQKMTQKVCGLLTGHRIHGFYHGMCYNDYSDPYSKEKDTTVVDHVMSCKICGCHRKYVARMSPTENTAEWTYS
jgi:hypothetical protein